MFQGVMPLLSRWFIRTALLALIAGLVLAIATAAGGRAPLLAPTVLHLLVVGWLSQMVFGVAYWMFPTLSSSEPRGRGWVGWLCYVSLNAGLLLRVIAEPAVALGPTRGMMLLGSAGLQLTAAVAFVANTWPRVRERG
jgi:ABC-type phosphate transport system permease subunit